MVRNFSPQIPEGIEDSAWCRVPPGSINNAEAPNCLQKSGVQGAGARHQAIPQDARGQLGAKISPTDFAEEPSFFYRVLLRWRFWWLPQQLALEFALPSLKSLNVQFLI